MDLYLISPPEDSFIPRLPELFEAGVDWFQYRRPNRADKVMQAELDRIVPMSRRHDVTLIVNDRPDLCRVTGADGVHLGSDDVPVADVKSEWPRMVVGATHRVDEKVESAADYLGVGPVFSPKSKSLDVPACGWQKVKEYQSNTKLPVFAIGGLTVERLSDVPRNLQGIAVISAVWESSDPVESVKKIKSAIE